MTCSCKLQPNRQSFTATWRIQTRSWVDLPERFRLLENYCGPCLYFLLCDWLLCSAVIYNDCCITLTVYGCIPINILASGLNVYFNISGIPVGRLMSLEIKHWCIALARMCALGTIGLLLVLTCVEGNKSDATVTRRSWHELTTGTSMPSMEIGTSVTFGPILSKQHMSTETVNSQSLAQLHRAQTASWTTILCTSWVILPCTLTSSANKFYFNIIIHKDFSKIINVYKKHQRP